MWTRDGLAARCVGIYPSSCWVDTPIVYEEEDNETSTPFEEGVLALDGDMHLWHYLERLDEVSGVGGFGLLLIGIDDGLLLSEPVAGWDGGMPDPAQGTLTRKVTFLRVFSERHVTISEIDRDERSPRFGLPVMYTIQFSNANSTPGTDSISKQVHWSRVVHVADNCKEGEIVGWPRLQTVFNRLLDIKKIVGGSAEMFWQGAFPGIAFEINPALLNADTMNEIQMDTKAIKKEMAQYAARLQRHFAVQGVTAKTLAPQVASPSEHFLVQMKCLAISVDAPYRIFLGSEEAQLAGDQDKKAWNKKLRKRQGRYISPMIIKRTIKHLQSLGCLAPSEQMFVHWPSIDVETDMERASRFKVLVEALSAYANGNLANIIPMLDLLVHFGEFGDEVSHDIAASVEQHMAEHEDDLLDQAATETSLPAPLTSGGSSAT